MGYLSNPVGMRCGYNRAWSIKGLPPSPLFNEISLAFIEFTKRKFWKKRFQRAGVLFSHSLVRLNSINQLSLDVFLYDSQLEIFLFKFYISLRRFRFHLLKKKNTKMKFPRRNRKSFKRLNKKINWSYFFTYSRLNKRINFFSHINKNVVRGYRHLRSFLFNKLRSRFYNYYLQRFFAQYITKVHKLPLFSQVKIIPLSSSTLTSRSLANFALRKLRSRNTINSIFFPMLRGFSSIALGFRVICNGRFTRRQRAGHSIFWKGKVPNNTFSVPIDYTFVSIPLKYGVGSIKIWLTRHALSNKQPFILV